MKNGEKYVSFLGDARTRPWQQTAWAIDQFLMYTQKQEVIDDVASAE